MSPIRCPECEKNVSINFYECEVTDINFDDSDCSVVIEFHIVFGCAEDETELGEYDGESVQCVPKLADYLENHEDLDISNVQIYEDVKFENKIITRNGRKTYITKWVTQVTLNKRVFKVSGELPLTLDQINFS